jgi:aspartate carbamoyltransferase regulatory subunit
MSKTIGMIQKGINLDHISQGNAWYIIKLLKLDSSKYPVGIGLNLTSTKMGRKDLLKIENYKLSLRELKLISIFAVGATYSEIDNFNVIKKETLKLPKKIDELIICPNHRCISHQHKSLFYLSCRENSFIAECHYCTKSYDLKTLNNFKLK